MRKTKPCFSQQRHEKLQELNVSPPAPQILPTLRTHCYTPRELWVSHTVLTLRHPLPLFFGHRVSILHLHVTGAGNCWGTTPCESSQGSQAFRRSLSRTKQHAMTTDFLAGATKGLGWEFHGERSPVAGWLECSTLPVPLSCTFRNMTIVLQGTAHRPCSLLSTCSPN